MYDAVLHVCERFVNLLCPVSTHIWGRYSHPKGGGRGEIMPNYSPHIARKSFFLVIIILLFSYFQKKIKQPPPKQTKNQPNQTQTIPLHSIPETNALLGFFLSFSVLSDQLRYAQGSETRLSMECTVPSGHSRSSHLLRA